MRSIFTLVFVLTLAIQINAQDAGIDFVKTDWQTTLADAKASDKIIFVDAYTTWCGPCKWMSAKVFTDQKVADFYNSNFINVKLDMEKGEGLDFAKKYKVKAYPTLLFIDGEGNMVHQALGSRAVDDFIELGKTAADPEQNIGGLKSQYDNGNRDPGFIKQYAQAMQEARVPGADKIAMDYLEGQDNWSTPENMEFVFAMMPGSMDSKLSEHVTANRKAYYEVIGEEEVDQKLEQTIMMDLRKSGEYNQENLEAAIRKNFGEKADQKVAWLKLQYSMTQKGEEGAAKFEEALMDYAKQYPFEGWQQMNSVAWHIYEVSDNPNLWKLGRELATKSIQEDSNYFNNDTMAALCFKLGEKDNALKYAKEAITLAKESGMNYEETEKLVEKIEEL